MTERVDWEVELAVVVGREMRSVATEIALEHVRGYTVANDVLGPVLVPAEDIADPQALGLRTRVNGETVQNSNTSEMVFGVAELLAFCSYNFTLEPGDLLLTGTPWGCGEFMEPKRSLKHGDVVEVEIDGIGTLRNPVVER